jgi:crossover junction endodeoxyribonuclease RuvC
MIANNKIILGIDPGTVVMGYAVIEVCGDRVIVATMDVLKLGSTKDIYERLEMIHSKVNALIALHKPHTFAIEAPFFGKNVQSMLKLGRAQGVAIAAAMQSRVAVTEYSPKKVKQSITGNGNANKDQVWRMLQRILNIE